MQAVTPRPRDVQHLIICGAEKAGTTSLFGYLAAHPGVVASSKKETDHFRREGADLAGYAAFFDCSPDDKRVRLESSPGYLAEADTVAPRMAALLPHAKLVFVLRDPIERLRSSFRFYKSRLHVPQDMSFERFVTVCLGVEEGTLAAADTGLAAWHLGAIARGRYERLLPPFERHFAPQQMLVLAHAALQRDARAAVQRIAEHAGLDPTPYRDHVFARENVSFMARHAGMQRVAVAVNDSLEGLWRRHPGLKRQLLAAYKRFNERPMDADELDPATAVRLRAHYADTYAWLAAR